MNTNVARVQQQPTPTIENFKQNQAVLEQVMETMGKQTLEPEHDLFNLYETLHDSVESQIKVLNGVIQTMMNASRKKLLAPTPTPVPI
jgi:hypothetical protein